MAHSPEVKAQVMAALLAGQGTMELARRYDLPAPTVSRWRSEVPELAREHQVGSLLMDYLTELLITVRHQAVVTRDPEWLLRNSASEVGVLHGILVDKAVRLLEAMEPPSEPTWEDMDPEDQVLLISGRGGEE